MSSSEIVLIFSLLDAEIRPPNGTEIPQFQNQSFQIEFFDSGRKGLIFGFPTSFFLITRKGVWIFGFPRPKSKRLKEKIQKITKTQGTRLIFNLSKNYPKKTRKKIDFLDFFLGCFDF